MDLTITLTREQALNLLQLAQIGASEAVKRFAPHEYRQQAATAQAAAASIEALETQLKDVSDGDNPPSTD